MLAEAGQGEKPIHYRTWFELLRSNGFLPGGKDSLATFLTQIGRSSVVVRSTAAGMYSLNLGYPAQARRRLERLRELLHVANELPADAGVADIEQTHEQIGRLTRQVTAAEREVAEVLRSLGSERREAGSSADRRADGTAEGRLSRSAS